MNLLEALTWFSVVTTAGLMIGVVVRRPPAPLWPSLLFVTIAAFVWTLGETLTTFAPMDQERYWQILALEYTGVLFLPATWWLFGLRFAEIHGHVLPSRYEPLRWIPIGLASCFWIAMVTNPWHGHFITPVLGDRNEFQVIWYAQAGTGYALLLGLVGLFAWMLARASDATLREQLAILITASLVPMVCNFLYVSAILPSQNGLTAAGLGVSMMLFLAGIYRDRLFSLSAISMSHLIANETDGMLLLDGQGRLLHFNPAAARLFDGTALIPDADVFALLSRELLPADSGRQASPSQIERELVARGAQPDGVAYRLASKPDRWLEIQVVPISKRSGRRLGTGLRLRDVSDLRVAREQLRAQATVLEAILDSAEQGMLVVDSFGAIVYSNRAFAELWSIRHDEIDDAQRVLARVVEQLENPGFLLDELDAHMNEPSATSREELHLLDGRVVERASRPLLKDGQVAGRVWSFFDVTAERAAEAERHRFEARMLQAQKMESLGILAGGVAHDFNNLLAGIMGNADLALNLAPPESELRDALSDIVGASRRAAELINQMLAYSGRSRFVVGAIDLCALTQEIHQLLHAVIDRSARVELDLAPVPLVQGDATQLRQVVMNLITNASDALEGGSGTIVVSTRSVNVTGEMLAGYQLGDAIEPGPYVCLEVADTGKGMDEATAARIFDPFYTTKFTGRGLGLSAVLGIMRAHGGAIRVESGVGRGTTIRLLLPPADATAVATEAAEGEPDRASPWSGRGCVLVADDEPAVLRLLVRLLGAAGFEVATAASGAETLELWRERRSEIVAVILDMTMPGRDDRDTLADLREAGATVPIILASGYSRADAEGRLAEEAPDAFIQKPFSSSELIETLRRVMGQ